MDALLEDSIDIQLTEAEACKIIYRLLVCLRLDPDKPGMEDTPRRMFRALQEMTAGYACSPAAILDQQFDEPTDEVVVLRDIEFQSLCEHHILPFYGTVDIAYLPGERVVGLSKMARLVDAYARRLQVQERLATQIAEAMEEFLGAKGVAVIVRATHLCMSVRGVRKRGAEMVVSVMRGVFRESAVARAEVMELLRR